MTELGLSATADGLTRIGASVANTQIRGPVLVPTMSRNGGEQGFHRPSLKPAAYFRRFQIIGCASAIQKHQQYLFRDLWIVCS